MTTDEFKGVVVDAINQSYAEARKARTVEQAKLDCLSYALMHEAGVGALDLAKMYYAWVSE